MIPASSLTSALAIVGRTGSGKTYAAKSAVERLLADGAPVCVIDPTGAWWGLRAAPDGKRSRFAPVIFGGDHADVPIDEGAGERLAALIAGGKARASIIDVSEFTGGQTYTLLTAFFEELYRLNKTSLHLVMDEADVMAPQQPLPEQRRLKGAVNKIVRRGRIRGIRPMMITQRPAVIDKSVLSQISTLVAMRLTAPQDRKAIEDWVKGNADAGRAREVLDALPSLGVGEGFVWSPADDVLDRVKFPLIATFDSSRAPEEGDAVADAGELPAADLAALREALAAPAPEASAGNVARERQASEAELSAAERRGYERGYEEGRERGERWARNALDKAAPLVRQALDLVDRERGAHAEDADARKPAQAAATSAARQPSNDLAKLKFGQDYKVGARAVMAGSLSPTARKIIDVLQAAHPVALTFKAAALRAGASPRSSQFRSYRREIEDCGLVEIVASDRLRAFEGRPVPPGTSPIDLFASRMAPSQGALLRALASAGGPITKDEAADAASISRTSSGLGAGLKELVELDLAIRGRDGRYEPSAEMREAAGGV